mmetsp:Transcript_94826/g.306139  ORF Transcript_94826/g.306139 Transcript_94826/m.306139 type:complete len:131 (+) Transcript_94826:95-487(+)
MGLPVTVITWLFTPIGLMGWVHLLVAFKPDVLPEKVTEKFGKTLKAWSKVVGQDLPSQYFFGFFGLCKLSGLMAIHGLLGPSLDLLANVCWLVLLGGAAYTHVMLKEGLAAPLGCLGMMAARLALLLMGL